jgi:hypothetical protein
MASLLELTFVWQFTSVKVWSMNVWFLPLLPLLVAISAIVFWKLAYVGRRPLSRGVKFIVFAILVWSSLPLLLVAMLYLLAASGGRMGD